MTVKNPVLMALTPEAEGALGGPLLILPWFPFRLGRDSRGEGGGGLFNSDRRATADRPNNDFFIRDPGRLKNVSREHFQIEQIADGSFLVLDRGSACGTLVGNTSIGGHRKREHCKLEDGNVIVVGASESPFVFKFLLEVESG